MDYVMTDMRKEPDSEPESKVLSGASPIQVKFIGWLVIVCASGFGGSIWWAAVMSTKLDLVISNQATQMAATKAVVEDVSRLKEWRIQVDTSGSLPTTKRLDQHDRDISELQKQFELHKVTTSSKP